MSCVGAIVIQVGDGLVALMRGQRQAREDRSLETEREGRQGRGAMKEIGTSTLADKVVENEIQTGEETGHAHEILHGGGHHLQNVDGDRLAYQNHHLQEDLDRPYHRKRSPTGKLLVKEAI